MVVTESERSEDEFFRKIYITFRALVLHGRRRKEITGDRSYIKTLPTTHDRTISREGKNNCRP